MTSYRTYTTTICPWIFQARPGRGSAGRGFITQWCGRIWQGNDPTGKQGSRPARSLQRASSASKGPGQGQGAARGMGRMRQARLDCSSVCSVQACAKSAAFAAQRVCVRSSVCPCKHAPGAPCPQLCPMGWDILLCAKENCGFRLYVLENPRRAF